MDAPMNELNARLDAVDGAIVNLLRQRTALTGQLASAGDGDPPAERERRTLALAASRAGEPLADCAEAVFRAIQVSDRSLQNQRAGRPSPAWETIRTALKNTPPLFPQRATVACQGVEGAYSQQVCDGLFKLPSILYFDSFDHVFRAVESGLCRYGVLPVENSTAGSVNAIYDLMNRHHFSIVRSARLRVCHCLLANGGVRPEQIREIYSHEQALSQCSDYLAGLAGVKITPVENTAAAARLVARSGRTDAAALSSRTCAENYGLDVLAQNVQNSGCNYTRFICISKQSEIYPGADRISLMMVLPHRPGSLYNVVSKFNSLGINMRKIESRPLPGREFEFLFYFDIEASVYAPETEALFRDLESASEVFRYLGAYGEILC